jgi:tripartite-type tricarboxylate transporter receptor subunit TctC
LRRRHILERAAVAFAIFALATPIHAQGYPSKPISVIVGFPPGGGMDLSARVYSAKLQEALDTPIVIENRPGGTGLLAGGQRRNRRRRADRGRRQRGGERADTRRVPARARRDFGATHAARAGCAHRGRSGVPGYDIAVWAGLFAPAGTPAAIVSRLYREALRAMNAPDTKEKLRGIGMDPGEMAPEQLTAMIKADIAKYGAIVKAANIR